MKRNAKRERPSETDSTATRGKRADAQRNLEALLEAAKGAFAAAGVDAPVRDIASRAGVGVATVYRHFPQRSDLIAAVFRREVDACAAAAPVLAREHDPADALAHWLRRYTAFLAAKRGLAAALYSGDPAFASLPAYFRQHLEPALRSLLARAVAAGQVRGDVEPYDLLRAVANLSMTGDDADGRRMVDVLIDGLRYVPGERVASSGGSATRKPPRARGR